MSKRSTGEPTEYDAHEEGTIEAALDAAWQEYEAEAEAGESGGGGFGGAGGGGAGGGDGGGEAGGPAVPPTGRVLAVTGIVEWQGSRDRGRDGQGTRTVRLDQLTGRHYRELAPFVQRAREAKGAASSAAPLKSYRAKGARAQARQLFGTKRGRQALALAGLRPTPRTVTNWLTGKAQPSKQNREKIAKAYDSIRNNQVIDAGRASKKANHELSEKLNEVIKDAYGNDVRFFGDVRMDFE